MTIRKLYHCNKEKKGSSKRVKTSKKAKKYYNRKSLNYKSSSHKKANSSRTKTIKKDKRNIV